VAHCFFPGMSASKRDSWGIVLSDFPACDRC